MITECVQMLCTNHRFLDGQEIVGKRNGRKYTTWKLDSELDSVLYTATHINHPSTAWARKNDENYSWLWQLVNALSKEYTYRYGKIHKCESSGLINNLKTLPKNIPVGQFTQPTPAMDSQYIIGDSIQSYRHFYIVAKKHLANWNGKINSRQIPEWYKE